ncbi:hypothetical protein [Vitiosangium sp. GDMCC 1.1324]|uniref:hypothetical protein n=1 Tax=Vitiosangium sp. (strain GDMCC 1.1324) TaxID=2138576 RepID=UPI000D375CF1|nr:hypothetical protein [Vitiosangium sp. GDMCC 1.1324]PTL77113.1 hypothetical protein DAT35_46605 [Vitiosangium sp. GDMCC 1.1324]
MSSSATLCALHPERPAVGTCARCGAFFCEPETIRHGERAYCEACGRRPEVSYLEELRVRLWGKRDTWAWLMMLSAPAHVALCITMGLDGMWNWAVLAGADAVVVTAWFLGVRLARPALLLLPPAWMVGLLLKDREALHVVLLMAPPMALALAAFSSTRSQLFFRLEVDPGRLERLWEAHGNNPLASRALLCGLVGLLVPVAAPVAVLLGWAALRRVNPEAHPPVGKKAQALEAMMLGGLSMLGWTYLLVRLKLGLPLNPL